MALIVCPKCGTYHDRKIDMCPTCQFNMAETKKIEKIVLEIHNEFRKKSSGFGKKKELEEICQKTGMNIDIAREFLENMEHPKDFVYSKKSFFDEKAQTKGKHSFLDWCNEVATNAQTVRCPKCHSTSIDYQGKISYGRAAIGGLLAGETGAVLGGLTGKKGYAVCLNCGKRWKV